MNVYIYIFLIIGIFIFIFYRRKENFSKDTIVEGTNIVEKLKKNINIFNDNISTLTKTNIKGNNLYVECTLDRLQCGNFVFGNRFGKSLQITASPHKYFSCFHFYQLLLQYYLVIKHEERIKFNTCLKINIFTF